MASCADRLHQIQEDVGLTDKELKKAVHNAVSPKEISIKELRVKTSKAEKLRNKYEKVGGKKRKYQMAYWYLEEYLKPEYAHEIYMKYLDFKELVNYAYEMAMNVIEMTTYRIRELSPEEVFAPQEDDDFDIPEDQWEAFGKYCEDHKLKSARDIEKRREKFRKFTRKKRKIYYSKKRLRMYDPLFASTTLDEHEMLKNLKRISKENEQRVKKFHEMLESLCPDQSIGAEVMKQFDKQTKEIMKAHDKRIKQFMKEHNLSPTPVQLDFDDQPRVQFDPFGDNEPPFYLD